MAELRRFADPDQPFSAMASALIDRHYSGPLTP
jgi:hypothetical protein